MPEEFLEAETISASNAVNDGVLSQLMSRDRADDDHEENAVDKNFPIINTKLLSRKKCS